MPSSLRRSPDTGGRCQGPPGAPALRRGVHDRDRVRRPDVRHARGNDVSGGVARPVVAHSMLEHPPRRLIHSDRLGAPDRAGRGDTHSGRSRCPSLRLDESAERRCIQVCLANVGRRDIQQQLESETFDERVVGFRCRRPSPRSSRADRQGAPADPGEGSHRTRSNLSVAACPRRAFQNSTIRWQPAVRASRGSTLPHVEIAAGNVLVPRG